MKPVIIDIAGTIAHFANWMLMQFLFLLGIILFGLSAPILFTVGIELLAWRGSHMEIWSPIYFILAPFACCIWMVFICYLGDPKFWRALRRQRAGELNSWRNEYGGIYRTVGKSIWFMVAGFFGSISGEVIFLYGVATIYPDYVNPRAYMVVFAVAPFFGFAPVPFVLVSRWFRRDEYVTA